MKRFRKRKWFALVLCIFVVASGLQVNSAYAMEEQKVLANDMTEIDFEHSSFDLSFAIEPEIDLTEGIITTESMGTTGLYVEL